VGVAVSPDGRSVYVIGFDSLTVFERSPTGALRQLACFRDPADRLRGCAAVRSFTPQDIAVSGDSRNVYVASALRDPAGGYNARLIVFNRDPSTRLLAPLPGRAGCVGAFRVGAAVGCTVGRGFDFPTAVVAAPDGRYVYVGAADGRITIFARDAANGSLRQLPGARGCVRAWPPGLTCKQVPYLGYAYIARLALSPNGRTLFALEPQPHVSNYDIATSALLVFKRNPRQGGLQRLSGATGCVVAANDLVQGCEATPGLEANPSSYALAASADGRNLYVGDAWTLDTFRLQTDGGARPLRGDRGCVNFEQPNAVSCAPPTAETAPASLMLGPDGRVVYFAFAFGPNGRPGRLLVLDRDTRTGAPRRRVEAGCFARVRIPPAGCTSTRALDGPVAMAMSPDGANLYVTGSYLPPKYGSATISEIAVFRTR
jgi:hypothetical protein